MRHGIQFSDTPVLTSSFARDSRTDPSPASLGEEAVGSNGQSQYSLRQILPTARFVADDDVVFRSIAESPNTARQGELVVYRIGEDCPAKLVADALARGASGILTEQLLPCPLPQCIVADVELSMASVNATLLDRPDRKMLTVGVVGSAGKTTTSLLISSLLRSCGIRAAYQTDLGDSDGIVQSTSETAMPVNSELVEWFSEAHDSQCNAAVVEISDEEARRGHYDAVEFDMVVVTGSATCSGDFGPSGLQCVLERLARDGVIVAPIEDRKTLQVARDGGARVVTYGIRQRADVTAKIIDQSNGMTTLLVTHQDTTAVMETSLCGAGTAANHAAAILVGLLVEEPLHEIVEKLSQLRSIPGRGQRIDCFSQPAVIVDAGGTTDRVATALRSFRSMKSGGQLWCVLAIDPADEPEFLARYGSLIERFADQAVITAQPSGKQRFLAASHAILDGVKKCAAFRLVADRKRALQWAMSEASTNDTILFFTGEKDQSANQQRTDIERISEWVQSARASDEQPVQLSIFK